MVRSNRRSGARRSGAGATLAAGLLTLTAPSLLDPAGVRAEEPSPSSLTGQTLQRIERIKNEAMGLQRAINVARGTAAKLNGGLGVYRPAVCMYQGINNNPCLVSRTEEGFTFRFLGGSPGWEQLQLPPTVETEMLISPDGRTVVQILYNGIPRGT